MEELYFAKHRRPTKHFLREEEHEERLTGPRGFTIFDVAGTYSATV